MTSHGPDTLGSGFTGHLSITPELNGEERAYVARLASEKGTLRGTRTGRGDRDVPFAHSGWEICVGGCCLTWNPARESSRMMVPTLDFLINHLLRRGARGDGDYLFWLFTFNHVVEGVVLGCAPGDTKMRLVEVSDNVANERLLPLPCGPVKKGPAAPPRDKKRRGELPANVIELRPRRA